MSYLKPRGEEDTKYNVKLSPTHTQNGFSAMRFIGDEVPDTYTEGFIYYDDEDNVISDLSEYKFSYSPNVYAISDDVHTEPKPNNTPTGIDVSSDNLALEYQIEALNQRIDAMETYTETKTAYIGDTEAVFDIEKEGAVSAQLTVDGLIMPCKFFVEGNKITVTFDELEEVGEVTVFIIQ